MIDQQTLDFYNKNKDLKWTLPDLPIGIHSKKQLAAWIVNNPQIGWLELDIEIDLDKWKQEAIEADKYFVDHRGEDHPGWNSCCIHGVDIDKTGSWTNYGYTDESQVPYHWTELSEKTPTITDFWKNTYPVEKYRRVRFMELEPNGYIQPHSDMPGRLPGEFGVETLDHGIPVNIAIVHPDNCHMVVENFGTVPWEEGKVISVNIRHYHSVINFSSQRRIHMIGHGMYGNKIDDFCDLIIRSYMKQLSK